MAKADSVHSTPPLSTSKNYPEEQPDPLWAQALIRLGNATERMAAGLEALYGRPIEPGAFVPNCRQLVQDLIDFLDLFEPEETALPLDLSSRLSSQTEADMLLAQWQANRVLPPHLRLDEDRS
jgi:hypothetical protein